MSTHNMALMALLLARAMAYILTSHDLRYLMVRLMQAVTGTMIAGSTIPLLADNVGFKIHNVDFYAVCGKGFDVQRFLRMSGKFAVLQSNSNYDKMDSICNIWTLHVTIAT